MNKHLMLAVDDSATSNLALDYILALFGSRDDVALQLVHCLSSAASPLPQPEDEKNSLLPDLPQANMKKAALCLEKSNSRLLAAGIPESRLSSVTLKSTSVASSILGHAEKQLADAIVVARRGVGILGEMLFGSTSASLFEKSRSVPLWIIDGVVNSNRFLVPVDGTPQSLMAIDHLAHIFAHRDDIRFFLFHARGFLSPPPVCKPENFYDKWGKDWCDTHLSGNGCMFTGPTELLTEAGIPRDCVTPLPVPTAMEESGAIIKSAKQNNCGTIVIGRRPHSEAKGVLGGVSRRTINQTENMALWVIG